MSQKQQHRMFQTSILIFWIEPNFQEVNRLFLLLFNANDSRTGHSRSFLPTRKVEECNVLINGRNIFNHPVKKWYKSIWKHSKKLQLVKEMIRKTVCLLD